MKVFLSSTFVDLGEVRAEISRWLSGVFGAELIIMETFGSDTAPPNISSVRRVRECDIFVGIYAGRYGTVDDISGKSITELELDEAKNALSTGIIKAILLYLLEPTAKWPSALAEPGAEANLKRLFGRAKQHTCTYFLDRTELPFLIVRDVYRESVPWTSTARKLREPSLPTVRVLRQPFGMEFLTTADRAYLAGRETEIDRLASLVEGNQICLLLGDSGIGKTSLIQAGLIPALSSRYRCIYVRPFGLADSDVVNQIQTSLFDGKPSYKGTLPPLLAEASAAVGESVLLLIIDQFEDILASRDAREIKQLVDDLRTLRELNLHAVRVLIAYRADLEGRLGEFWQHIAGSPQGLPRLYVQGVDERDAWKLIEKTAHDLRVRLELTGEKVATIRGDLTTASRAISSEQLYPPYVQILIEHIWSVSQGQADHSYSFAQYSSAGSIEGIVGSYLGRVLGYARDSRGDTQAVLVTLVRSYGAKRQVTLEDVAAETSRSQDRCEVALEKLIDYRLVRHIGEYYEVSHDFVARKVLFELVDSDELKFKRFRELLASKAAAYGTTKNLLSVEELTMLYVYRERILPVELEVRLLLASWLDQRGPALYWIMKTDPSPLLLWLTAEMTASTDNREISVRAVLLKRKLTEKAIAPHDYSLFRGYQLALEFAGVILENPSAVPEKVLIHALRHRRAEVRNAALQVVIFQVCEGRWAWVERFHKSKSRALRAAYEELVRNPSVPLPSVQSPTPTLRRFSVLKQLASSGGSSNTANALYRSLRNLRSSRRNLILGNALRLVQNGRVEQLVSAAGRFSADECREAFAAINGNLTDRHFEFLLQTYVDWNMGRPQKSRLWASNSNALAASIYRTANESRMPFISAALDHIVLWWSSRPLVAALLKFGGPSELQAVVKKIAQADYKVDYWNHTELGSITEERLRKVTDHIPPFLREISDTQEFWTHIEVKRRKSAMRGILLPIRESTNRALYIRISAYALLGTSREKDQDLLIRLAGHEYGLIARSAARCLVRCFGNRALELLTAQIEESVSRGKAKSIAGAVAEAEMQLFGVAPRN